tara:strand:+ start:383 stop:604 length:222 start_codon:yes stop_codon:yes gene_type:complete
MYFNETNKFFYGIMFHHFHDDSIQHRSQGSISKDGLYKIIKFIGRNNILEILSKLGIKIGFKQITAINEEKGI